MVKQTVQRSQEPLLRSAQQAARSALHLSPCSDAFLVSGDLLSCDSLFAFKRRCVDRFFL